MMTFTSVQSCCASSSSVSPVSVSVSSVSSSSPQAVITSAVAGTSELLLNSSHLWVIVSIAVIFLGVLLVSVGMIAAAFVFRRHRRKSRKEMENIHQWRITGTRVVVTVPVIYMCIHRYMT